MPNDSFDLLVMLKNAGYLKELRDPLWWPRSGSYEVVVGTILTQQTKWEKVEKSLENLKNAGVDSLEEIAKMNSKTLSLLIKPSGFYNTKAKYLLGLARNIIKDFGSFEEFCSVVGREWLLTQKGVGQESADSILCFGCLKDFFVVDSYTQRFLKAFGYEFESYEQIQEWMSEGILSNRQKIDELYGRKMGLNEIYALFHGKIVEYCKDNSRGKSVSVKNIGDL
ncbi:MAG: 3-methyladenine DNA glycosylase [Sulfurospirillum sp.]